MMPPQSTLAKKYLTLEEQLDLFDNILNKCPDIIDLDQIDSPVLKRLLEAPLILVDPEKLQQLIARYNLIIPEDSPIMKEFLQFPLHTCEEIIKKIVETDNQL